MPAFAQFSDAARAWWDAAAPANKALAVGLAVILVAALAFAGSMASRPDYTPIYHGVSGKDAQAIQTVLQEHSILMRFDDHDGSVSVPSKDESTATMYVEAAGILSKDSEISGIESLDKIGMGTSSDVERQRILAANEGELSRKLGRLDPVSKATVALSPGNASSLFGTDVAPTASVILTLKSGETLSSEQVKGIVNLTAHAVTGLTPANVTLTDQTGAQLWKDNGAGGNALGDGQPLDESMKYAETVRLKLQNLLDSTLGPRKSIVTVNAELDFNQTQIDSTEHSLPAGQTAAVPVSTREKDETYSGAGASAAGGAPAGTASNGGGGPPTYGGSASGGGGGTFKSNDNTTNYGDPNTKHTVTQKAPGGLKTMSVAALVDASVPAASVQALQAILAGAITATPGDPTRMVTVQQIAFDTSAQKAQDTAQKAAASAQMMNVVLRAVAAVVVAALLLFMLLRTPSGGGVRGAGGRRLALTGGAPHLALEGNGANIGLLEGSTDNELDSILEERPLSIEDVLSEMPEPELVGAGPRRAARRRMLAPSIEEQQDIKLESIQEMVAEHPDSVALLIKGWMAE